MPTIQSTDITAFSSVQLAAFWAAVHASDYSAVSSAHHTTYNTTIPAAER